MTGKISFHFIHKVDCKPFTSYLLDLRAACYFFINFRHFFLLDIEFV